MPYIERDADGAIKGVYHNQQAGYAEEWMDDAAPELLAFLNEPEEEPETVVIVFAVDLWSRMTDAEAEVIEAAMTTQPARIQNIFRAANSYRSDHELWPLLVSMATGLFGAPRAAQILAAS